MIRYHRDMPTEFEDQPAGGVGQMTFHTLLKPEVLGGRTGMFAVITLEPGNTVGEHLHDTDSEVFFLLEGEAVMLEDGKCYPVAAGDIEYCPKGHSHGLEPRGDRAVKFLALQFK